MPFLQRSLLLLLLIALAAGAFVLRCHNVRETFIEGRIYFVDDDCYSRMTRVKLIAEHPGSIIRHHDFENYPAGVHSHATAPLDYLILAGQGLLEVTFAQRSWGRESLLASQTRDLAGALVSPLLGSATCVFLALWGWWIAGSLPLTSRVLRALAAFAPALLFAVSPMAVQATVLGRPDHQSLLVLLLAVALGAEIMLAKSSAAAVTGLTLRKEPLDPAAGQPRVQPAALESAGLSTQRCRWGILAGSAWGGALWVSLYEPALLLAATLVLLALFQRGAFRAPERRWEAGLLGGLLLLSFLVEGWRLDAPSQVLLKSFSAWSRSIGEMRSLPLTSPDFSLWLGWLYYVSPLLLAYAAWRLERRAWPVLTLLLFLIGLTAWQVRWSPYLVVVFCLALPWQLLACRRWWVALPVLLFSLFGPARYWDAVLFPDSATEAKAAIERREKTLLRDVALHLQGQPPQPFLSAWWEAPALAYWSGQPGVAGSSHQSLAGIVASSEFFLDRPASGFARAKALLRERQVAYVVTDEASRLIEPAETLLETKAAPDCLAMRLNENPNGAAPFLVPVYSNSFFQVFAIEPAILSHE